jgi:DNA invertase Pin-like site-specific DNA recombinase
VAKRSRSSPRNAKANARCAIYTRKSSEEGLEQDFNSLDAQREACEAYIRSQKHEGWSILTTHYDDGGISGATMERPALQRLLADVRSGRIDVVVLYKVDRLTRSLTDFAKIVEVLDARGASFVSVTQQFNTTTSMGRLTLNVLLSFAQFEREIAGERIRDKIAASKKKGLWMGGFPPLGYDIEDRKLVINDREAEVVRQIFRRYGELGSVRRLQEELEAAGIVSKERHSESGRCWGGKPLARGALYRMLKNPIYRGRIAHKDKSYPGEHEAIVPKAFWDRVQQRLSDNRVERADGRQASTPSLLTGLLFDDRGHRMTPSHAVKHGRRYRYYVSRPLTVGCRASAPAGRRIPAGEIERLVAERIRQFLLDDTQVFEAICRHVEDAGEQRQLLARAAEVSRAWTGQSPSEARVILRTLVGRVDVQPDRVDIHLDAARLSHLLGRDPDRHWPADDGAATQDQITLPVSARLMKAGKEIKMIVDGSAIDPRPDPSLIRLIVKAHGLREKLLTGDGASLGEIARREGVHRSYFTRVLRLAFLSPNITNAILDGRHPPDLTAARLMRTYGLPIEWQVQESALGFS